MIAVLSRTLRRTAKQVTIPTGIPSGLTIPEIRRMFGIPEYVIRVQVADLAAYEHWLTTQLMGDPAIARVDSRITMKTIKTDRGERRSSAR